jgi:hypothetical protein
MAGARCGRRRGRGEEGDRGGTVDGSGGEQEEEQWALEEEDDVKRKNQVLTARRITVLCIRFQKLKN